jgi:hypothetical protein
MAVRYKLIAKPYDGPVTGERIVQASGAPLQQQEIGNCPSVPAGNNLVVLQSLVSNTVDAGTAQRTGLLGYLAAIQAGTVTTTVETAIAAL